jgi:hypothetical protein
VRDETHVRLVDAHAEGDRRNNHDTVLLEEARLARLAFGGGEARVVSKRVDAVVREHLRRLLHGFARQAVHDARLARVLLADEAQQLSARRVFRGDAIADVGPVETLHEGARLAQVQALDDLAARGRIGGGGQRDARHRGVALRQHRELQVLLAEVMPPLRDAMRLVDREEGDRELIEQREAALGDQPLRREVQEIQLAGARAALHRLRGLPVERRIQELGAHPGLLQRRDLVLHQRDQRRDDDAHALAQQRGQLVADRLAAAGRHQHQGVAAGRDVRDDLGLVGPEGGVAEDVVEEARGARGQVGHAAIRRRCQ